MNTLPPSDSSQSFPLWTLFFQDRTTYTSNDGSWSDIADLVEYDGVTVYATRKAVDHALLRHPHYPEQVHNLVAPEGRSIHFFAFQRQATRLLTTDDIENDEAIENQTRWLYSCYGYTVPAYRIILLFSPDGAVTQAQPRNLPFVL